MREDYIELKQRRDLGDIINTYFDFLKQNSKSFTNIFISYNGILLLVLLGVSYLLVTGFIGLYSLENGFGNSTENENYIYLGAGGVLFLCSFLVVGALNYSLASSYIINYDTEKQVVQDKRNVWLFVKNNVGKIIVFILFLALIYFAFMIVTIILAFIPLLGMLAQYGIQFTITGWLGLSFMVLLKENKSVTDAFGEGWQLLMSNFWKCVLVNFIMGILLGIIILLMFVVPGVISGLYTYHAVSTEANIAASAMSKIIYTISLFLALVIFSYSHALTQFVNGILYFSLHEEKYNTFTRDKINQIGASEE